MWIFHNLWSRWTGIVKKQSATRTPMDETLQVQVSGYSTKIVTVRKTLDAMNIQTPFDDLMNWDEGMVRKFVSTFVSIRFPTVLALNKIDHKDSARNINRICTQYGEDKVVLMSALSESFLKQMAKNNYIYYCPGDQNFKMFGEELEPSELVRYDTSKSLKPPPETISGKLLKIRDSVLFRYGTTGVLEVLEQVISSKKCFPVYFVDSLTKFSACDDQTQEAGVFRDCVLIPQGTTVKQSTKMVYHLGTQNKILFAHDQFNSQLSASHVVTPQGNILKLTMRNKIEPK
eukprot:TRINITY_DN8067_c0_g1_i5.p1 TRINITY_DN8067_c0_g1~~TRINITY_DN8067_c0_g1_i5.p1  ORF type:complete len:288 (-),score=36.99 TRINITY_DN8067_c0_g1_i5:92-955(-)